MTLCLPEDLATMSFPCYIPTPRHPDPRCSVFHRGVIVRVGCIMGGGGGTMASSSLDVGKGAASDGTDGLSPQYLRTYLLSAT